MMSCYVTQVVSSQEMIVRLEQVRLCTHAIRLVCQCTVKVESFGNVLFSVTSVGRNFTENKLLPKI